MAATETKPEAKEVGEHVERLICKTWVLKVSIHCQGCKREVKKVLQSIDGVYNIDIDLRQQKVVVTGNIDSETLIKKLTKTGKRAELWPENPDSKKKKKKKKKGKSKNKEKQSDSESSEDGNRSGDNEKETVKVIVKGGNTAKNSEGCATGKGGVQFLEPKPEVRQIVTLPAGNQPPAAEEKIGIPIQAPNNENGEKSGGGGGGKKKKKKGQKGDNCGNESATVDHSGHANRTQGQGPVPILSPANESPPRHHNYHEYAPRYYAPALPVTTVNYHAAYPATSSYGAAYYTSPQPYSYAHVYVHPPYESESYSYTSQPSYSFEFLSDENPNGCSVG